MSRHHTPSNTMVPRVARVLAPRMSPIITDGTVSLVLTDDYRINPYLEEPGFTQVDASLRNVMGVGLESEMWLNLPRQNGFRTMAANWVSYFDRNPDLMLARSVKEQNEYLWTRDRLGLPPLRWSADLKLLAERENGTVKSEA